MEKDCAEALLAMEATLIGVETAVAVAAEDDEWATCLPELRALQTRVRELVTDLPGFSDACVVLVR